jgi:hypothetical protein
MRVFSNGSFSGWPLVERREKEEFVYIVRMEDI